MVPTLVANAPLESHYSALLFTLVRLRLDAHLAPFVPTFEQGLLEWWEVSKQERGLLDTRIEAGAMVAKAGADLDHVADGIAATLLIETRKNRKSPLFTRYFGSKQPSRFVRMRLDVKLGIMRTWVPSLKESPSEALSLYGEILEKRVAEADAAIELLSKTEQELTDFRTFGARKQLCDKINGIRKQLYGDVAKMVHDHPEWSLTRSYVEALFEHETAKPSPSEAEIERKIEAAKETIEKLTALREKQLKEKEEEQRERAQAEDKAKLAKLLAAEKVAAEASAKLAAVKAEISGRAAPVTAAASVSAPVSAPVPVSVSAPVPASMPETAPVPASVPASAPIRALAPPL
jgi:hypothetical protein